MEQLEPEAIRHESSSRLGEEEDDELNFHRQKLHSLLYDWKRIPARLDADDYAIGQPVVQDSFRAKENSKYRTIWFQGVMLICHFVKDENLITDKSTLALFETKMEQLSTILEALTENKQSTSEDVASTDKLIDRGEELLKLAEPFV